MAIPTYGAVSSEEYRKLGLRAGLEVHQQLKTKHKLFCSCPAGYYSPDYDAEILRHMRPTLSELGEYDGTALMEFKTRKEIIYRLNRRTVCTYEMDDAPPFGLDDEALDHALEIAHLLSLNIVGEIHITRKQYLDGSIPTGFQRTTIIGTDGYIKVGGRTIGVRQLGLEEDACREVSDLGHTRTYLTDRLSMPLIEVVTEPELLTPEEAADAGQVIRMLTRSSGRVRRGHGAGRQDVNVSIRGGTRIEIKGVPRIPLIPALVHYEAFRQKRLLDLKEKLERRGVVTESFKPVISDVTRTLSRITYPPIKSMIESGGRVKAVLLPGFDYLLGTPLQPERTFASEISDRVRVIACLDNLPNILFRYMADPCLDPSVWAKVVRRIRASDQDGIVLVWGSEQDVRTAADEVCARCFEALEGVPSETRQMLGDGISGITGFERILPGPDRMYPDTDLPPIAIVDQRVERAKASVDDPPWVLAERYKELQLSPAVIERLILSPRRRLFERVLRDFPNLSTGSVIDLVVDRLTFLKRQQISIGALSDERLYSVIKGIAQGSLCREVYNIVVSNMAENPSLQLEDVLLALEIVPLEEEVASALLQTRFDAFSSDGGDHYFERLSASERASFSFSQTNRAHWKRLMGSVMTELRGRFSGVSVSQLLEKMTGDFLIERNAQEDKNND